MRQRDRRIRSEIRHGPFMAGCGRAGAEELMSVRISCIIPAWNAERYIAAAIDSVRNQTNELGSSTQS